MPKQSEIKPAVCPICGREYDGQEVDIIKQEGKIATMKTECLGCGNKYTFKAVSNNE